MTMTRGRQRFTLRHPRGGVRGRGVCRVRLGSPTIRGILHYINTWGPRPLGALPEEEATVQALRLLASAAEFDSATGGVNRELDLYPVVKTITAAGVRTVPGTDLKRLYEAEVSRRV